MVPFLLQYKKHSRPALGGVFCIYNYVYKRGKFAYMASVVILDHFSRLYIIGYLPSLHLRIPNCVLR